MWQQITTLSELDTIHAGTLISKDDPLEDSTTTVYKVVNKNADKISMTEKEVDSITEAREMKLDELFSHGWWMLKMQS